MRYTGVENWAPVFENVNAYKPSEFLYVPATTRGLLEGRSYNSSLRTTWQATPRNKIAGTYKQDTWCDCPNGITARRGSRGRPRLPLPAVAADTRGVDLAGDQSDAVRGCGHAPLRAMGIHASAGVDRLVSRVRDCRALDDLGHRAVDRARLSGAGGSTTTTRACRTSPIGRRWPMSPGRTASRWASTGCTATRRRPTTT